MLPIPLMSISALSSENRIIRLNTDGSVDTSFNIGTGFEPAGVSSIIEDSNGKIYVIGNYASYNGVSVGGIIRLNTNGTIDATFNSGTGFPIAAINSIIEDSNGKIYVGGAFTSYNGFSSNNIIRLNPDGTVDTAFNIGTGFTSGVPFPPSFINSIIEDINGKIYVGGRFASYNGTVSNNIIRLNTDGTVDTAFNIGTGFDFRVNSIMEDISGKIYVGGGFSNYNGTSANKIIRLNNDGSVDASFAYGSGFNGSFVREILEDSGNKIYLGGDFTTYDGTTSNRIIRLNDDGTIDTAFNIGAGFDSDVYSIIEDSNNKIYVGGDFTNYDGTSANRIIRLNDNGTIDTNFDYGTGFSATFASTVNSIIEDSNGKIYVGGLFTNYN